MNHLKCSQCAQQFSERSCRILDNSCGHFKCRGCLSKDASNCVTCTQIIGDGALGNAIEPKKVVCKTPQIGDKKCTKKQTIDECLDLKKIPVVKLFSIDLKEKTERKPIASKNSKVKKQLTIPSHIKSTELQNGIQYLCTICGSRFKHDKQISYHSYCATVRPFACTKCPKRFRRKAELNHHLNVHAGIRKFICDTCNASFYAKGKLVVHRRIHTGVKSHKCDKCDSKFYTSSALKEHALIHLETKQFACKICDARLSNISNLRKHEERHKNLVHECPMCNKKCHTKAYLRSHSKSCNKTFKCQQCDKVFHTKKDRDRHANTHSDARKFQCKYCNIKFNRKDNVRRHIKNSHAEIDLKARKSFTIQVDRRETNIVKKTKPDNIILPKTNTTNINIEPNPVVEGKTNNSVPLELNAASYSLSDLYKKIFIFKDHERFIPVTHCPDGSSYKSNKIKIIDNNDSDESNSYQNSEVLAVDDETILNSNSRETYLKPEESETILNPLVRKIHSNTTTSETFLKTAITYQKINFNSAICKTRSNPAICEALAKPPIKILSKTAVNKTHAKTLTHPAICETPVVDKKDAETTMREIPSNSAVFETLPKSVVDKKDGETTTCEMPPNSAITNSSIGEILPSPAVPLTHSNPLIYQTLPNHVVYGIQRNTAAFCEPIINTVACQTLPSSAIFNAPKNLTICEAPQISTNSQTLPNPMFYQIQPNNTTGETLSIPVISETQLKPTAAVVCETNPEPIINETFSNPVTGGTLPNPPIGETLPNPVIYEIRPNPVVYGTYPNPVVSTSLSGVYETFSNTPYSTTCPNSVIYETQANPVVFGTQTNPAIFETSNPEIYRTLPNPTAYETPNPIVYGMIPNPTAYETTNPIVYGTPSHLTAYEPTNSIIYGPPPNSTPNPIIYGTPPNSTPNPLIYGTSPNSTPNPIIYGTSPNSTPNPIIYGTSPNPTIHAPANPAIYATFPNSAVYKISNTAICPTYPNPIEYGTMNLLTYGTAPLNPGSKATDNLILKNYLNSAEKVPLHNLNNNLIDEDKIISHTWNSKLNQNNICHNSVVAKYDADVALKNTSEDDATDISLKDQVNLDLNKSGIDPNSKMGGKYMLSCYYLNYDGKNLNYKLDKTSQRRLDIFTPKDIMEANQQRQSVIFLSQTPTKTNNKLPMAIENNSNIPNPINSPQATFVPNESTSSSFGTQADNPHLIVVPNDSDCNKFLSQVYKSDVIVLPDDDASQVDKFQDTLDLNISTSTRENYVKSSETPQQKNDEVPSVNTKKDSSIVASNDENDSLKPVYLHKKVNYDQTPVHQHRNYSNKTNNPEVKKQLSKEELSELYKKILLPGYTGTKSANSTCSQSNVETTVKQSEPSSKTTSIFRNIRITRSAQSPPSNTQHWRRRLAHNSENS